MVRKPKAFFGTSGLRRGLFLGVALAFGSAAAAFEARLEAPGAPEELRERLLGASAVRSARAQDITDPQEVFSAALSEYRTLVSVLYDRGYFSPVVNVLIDGREAAAIPPLNPPRQIDVVEIRVQPGPQFLFGTAEIGPLSQPTLRRRTPGATLPRGFRTGEPATTGRIRDAAAAGITGWRQAGYAKAEVADQRIVANHAAARLDAEIRLAPGRKLSFGEMRIAPESARDSRVREEAIRRIAGFPRGDTFDPALAQKSAARLRRTGAFSAVSLQEAETANPDGTLDYTVAVTDAPRRHISFGAEVESTEGLNLSFAWMHRNLFGGAERFRFETEVRGLNGEDDIDGRLTLRLDRPAAFGPDYDLFYQFDIDLLDEEHYKSLRTYATVGVKRIFSDRLFAELAVTGGRSRAEDAFSKAAGLDHRDFYLAGLVGRAQWDRRDVPTNATDRFFLDARVTPFAGFDGADSGVHALLDGRAYASFANGRGVLAGRVQLGTLLGASQRGVPPELLFFSGGAGTVRGQPYESLGSMMVGPNVAGGRSLLAGSLELRGQVTEQISVVGFYDIAAVGNDTFVDGGSPTHAGAGLGGRYDIGGIGPLRLDLGWPVSGSTGDGLQFYIGIGQAF